MSHDTIWQIDLRKELKSYNNFVLIQGSKDCLSYLQSFLPCSYHCLYRYFFYASCNCIWFSLAKRRILINAYLILPRLVFMLTPVISAISLNE